MHLKQSAKPPRQKFFEFSPPSRGREKSCLTEISELMCSTGGKITILKHGQQSETGKSHVAKANTQEQQVYNPVVDFDEFKEDTKGTDEPYYS